MTETNPNIQLQHGSTQVGKRSIYTQFLVQAMRNVAPGQTFTYTEAESITELPKAKLMSYLYTAVEILLKDYGVVYECSRGVGYTRLHSEEVPSVTNQKQLTKIRSTTKRYRERLEAVDPSELSQESRTQHTLGLINVSLMEGVAARKAQRELTKEASSTSTVKMITQEQAISMFKGLFSGKKN